MLGKDLEESRFGVMLGERMKLEWVTVWGRRENDRWGTKGYKYPQTQNSNGHISKFGTSEKNL
jgi:hypothetical protein